MRRAFSRKAAWRSAIAGSRILDLAPASQQPMTDNELGLGIVFNGCIYNFRELRAELEGKGYRFFSEGDTEVILKAYHAWGAACVKRFKGMFAFALWERDSGRVVLVRDRLGIKPLYYAEGARLHPLRLDPAGAARGRRHRYFARSGRAASLLLVSMARCRRRERSSKA